MDDFLESIKDLAAPLNDFMYCNISPFDNVFSIAAVSFQQVSFTSSLPA